ncbi:alpha/beta hydrolase family protein [Chloroflexota bacterium]
MKTRDIVLSVEDLKIEGRLYLPGITTRTPYPAVCICHGIPSGKFPEPGDGGYPVLAERICRQGFAVLIFNFRGTGSSEGNFDILGWSRDLKAAIDYLYDLPELDGSCLSLLGFSGGAAVSVYVAAGDTRISSVVACACPAEFGFEEPSSWIEHFRSIGTFRDKDFPPSPGEWISGFKLVSPINHVAGIAPRPLLLVHGSRDETVNVNQAYNLYFEAGEPKQIIIVDSAGHGLRRNDRAMSIVIDWLKSGRSQN